MFERRRDLEAEMIGLEVATDRLSARDRVLVFNAARDVVASGSRQSDFQACRSRESVQCLFCNGVRSGATRHPETGLAYWRDRPSLDLSGLRRLVCRHHLHCRS
jgi:hypothetical protein